MQVPARGVAVCILVVVVVAHRTHGLPLAGPADVDSIHHSGDTDPVEVAALVAEILVWLKSLDVALAEGVLVPVVVVHPAVRRASVHERAAAMAGGVEEHIPHGSRVHT